MFPENLVFFEGDCYRLNVCFPPKFISSRLNPNGIIFGDGASKEVMKVKWSRKGGIVFWQDKGPYKKRHQRALFLSLSLHMQALRKGHMRT